MQALSLRSQINAYYKFEKDYERYRPKRRGLRFVDFNQGVDCRFVTKKKMKLMSEISIRPLRIAFDHLKYEKQYRRAVELAAYYGIREFSNYILYNYKDTPDDLYRRLEINMELCEKLDVNIYSFPMKYIPIRGEASKDRSYTGPHWNNKYIGAIQAILNVTKGIVAPPSRHESADSFFKKAFGKDLDEYHEILYMPEAYIVYRKLFEKELGYTSDWSKLFKIIKNYKNFDKLRKIIEINSFTNVNGHFRSRRLNDFLKHYMITRDNVKLIQGDIDKHKEIDTILKCNGYIGN